VQALSNKNGWGKAYVTVVSTAYVESALLENVNSAFWQKLAPIQLLPPYTKHAKLWM